MSWSDRRYDDDPSGRFGRPGGDWQGVRPSFDNPMTWSVPLLRFAGIAVRVHVIFVIIIVVWLARAAVGPDGSSARAGDVGLVALDLAGLFLIVLLHEFGHCFACRWARGEANEILMWPLGGLAFCLPPHRWRAHLATVLGGPAVNVVLFVLLVPLIGVLSGHWMGAALHSPFVRPDWVSLGPDFSPLWLIYALDAFNTMNLILLLFNLLPIFPLDGGRTVQTLLWPKFGYRRSMRLAVYTGYIGAIGLFIFGAVTSEWMLIGIAFFGGITCWFTLKQLQWTGSVMGDGGDDDIFAASQWSESEIVGDAEPEPPPETRRPERRPPLDEAETREVDRILAKIGEQGIDSLTSRERRLLQEATDRRRGS
ncbi:MAG: hypothetical protein GY715_16470 [Planctomycetes bacterium]|nr:hypothetical protein [Planctomycetota bacterium]